MASIFQESFDKVLADTLLSFTSRFPGEPAGPNDPMFRFAASVAFAKWGIQGNIDFGVNQALPDTAEVKGVERFAFNYGIDFITGESFEDFQARVLGITRNRKGGGREVDYIQVAEEVAGVDQVTIIDPAQEGLAKVGVVLLSAIVTGTVTSVAANKLLDSTAVFVTGMFNINTPIAVKNTTTGLYTTINGFTGVDELDLTDDRFQVNGEGYQIHFRIPIQSIIDEVEDLIEDFRPKIDTPVVRASSISKVQDVVMIVSGEDVDRPAIITDVEGYANNLASGEKFAINQLQSIATLNGAESVEITDPPDDQNPGFDDVILLGSVAVN